ncbi:MAG: 3-isopropylmalate dehydratase small subunit [Actinomycetota bacterium]
MRYKGNVWKYGRDVNTDDIIAAKYLVSWDAVELGKNCMETLDPEFVKKVKTGDILVAEENFGCGSSREHAPMAIKGAGVSVVIAKSFARIFFRNAINTGLPLLESKAAVDGISNGDNVSVDTETGKIVNETTGQTYQAKPYPEFLQELIKAGGLINYIKDRA